MTSADRQSTRAATLAVAATFSLLTLAACGGGGGGGSTSTMPPGNGGGGQTIPTRAAALTNSVTAANVVAALAKAAEALPSAGSVTQSSNVDDRNITTDQVHITAQYGSGTPSFSVRNGTAWSIGTSDGNPRRISDVTPPYQGVELRKRIADGTLYVNAYTDIEAPKQVTTGGTPVDVMTRDRMAFASGGFTLGRGLSTPGTLNGQQGTFTCSSTGCGIQFTGGVQIGSGQENTVGAVSGLTFVPAGSGTTQSMEDADYLSGGFWMIVPDDASSVSDYQFGAFADGSDPFVQSNLRTVTGVATYDGDATGVYSGTAGGSTNIGYFDADVRLTANFGDANGLGTISGSMTNFEVDGERTDDNLSLGTARIGSQNSGFFTGDMSGVDDEGSLRGNWGGQFFGNDEPDGKPGSVGGTFGGTYTYTDSAQGTATFVGAFGAQKQ